MERRKKNFRKQPKRFNCRRGKCSDLPEGYSKVLPRSLVWWRFFLGVQNPDANGWECTKNQERFVFPPHLITFFLNFRLSKATLLDLFFWQSVFFLSTFFRFLVFFFVNYLFTVRLWCLKKGFTQVFKVRFFFFFQNMYGDLSNVHHGLTFFSIGEEAAFF